MSFLSTRVTRMGVKAKVGPKERLSLKQAPPTMHTGLWEHCSGQPGPSRVAPSLYIAAECTEAEHGLWSLRVSLEQTPCWKELASRKLRSNERAAVILVVPGDHQGLGKQALCSCQPGRCQRDNAENRGGETSRRKGRGFSLP